MNKDNNILNFGKNKKPESNYELLKSLISNKTNHTNKTKILVIVLVLSLIVSLLLYFRSTLGYKLHKNQVISFENCPVVANNQTHIYHLKDKAHYNEVLEANKFVENRVCFTNEWQAVIAGYRKSKY